MDVEFPKLASTAPPDIKRWLMVPKGKWVEERHGCCDATGCSVAQLASMLR
jgi:hypothetical protein